MKVQQFRLDVRDIHDRQKMPANADCNVVLVFGSGWRLMKKDWFQVLSGLYPNAHILSASTAGEIFGDSILDDSLTVTAMQFEHTPVFSHSVNINDFASQVEAGISLGRQIELKGLSLLMIISDGHLVKAEKLLEGLYREIPESVKIAGGLAGDGMEFQNSAVGLNGLTAKGTIAALAFYGSAISAGISSFSGWEPFGPVHYVTRANDDVLFELDNKPALELYKEYLGQKVNKLHPAPMLPFYNQADSSIRNILEIDEQNKSLTFTSGISEGAKVQMMKFRSSVLVENASTAATSALLQNDGDSPQVSIVISSVGRKSALGPRAIEEIEAVHNVFGSKTTLTGFYSYGEISRHNGSLRSSLQNQTITVLSLYENEGAAFPFSAEEIKDYFHVEDTIPDLTAFIKNKISPDNKAIHSKTTATKGIIELTESFNNSSGHKVEITALVKHMPPDELPDLKKPPLKNGGSEKKNGAVHKKETDNLFSINLKLRKVTDAHGENKNEFLHGKEFTQKIGKYELQSLLGGDITSHLIYAKTILNNEASHFGNGYPSVHGIMEAHHGIYMLEMQLPNADGNIKTISTPILIMNGTKENGAIADSKKNIIEPVLTIYDNKAMDSNPPNGIVDLSYLKRTTGGDEALLNQTIRMFIDFNPGVLSDMNKYIAIKDWSELNKTAHKFISSLNFIGHAECKSLVKQLELNAAAEKNTEQFPQLLEKIAHLCGLIIIDLKSFLPPQMKVLVAEDDPLLLNSLEFRLKKEGYDVIIAADGVEAIHKIEKEMPDLVITDFMMPSASGMEIVHFVKNNCDKKIPVIMLSRVGIEKTIVDAFQLGADDYVTKPFSTSELLIRVKRLLVPFAAEKMNAINAA